MRLAPLRSGISSRAFRRRFHLAIPIGAILKLMQKAEKCEQNDREDIPYPRLNESWDDRIQHYERTIQAFPGYDRLLVNCLRQNPLGIRRESIRVEDIATEAGEATRPQA